VFHIWQSRECLSTNVWGQDFFQSSPCSQHKPDKHLLQGPPQQFHLQHVDPQMRPACNWNRLGTNLCRSRRGRIVWTQNSLKEKGRREWQFAVCSKRRHIAGTWWDRLRWSAEVQMLSWTSDDQLKCWWSAEVLISFNSFVQLLSSLILLGRYMGGIIELISNQLIQDQLISTWPCFWSAILLCHSVHSLSGQHWFNWSSIFWSVNLWSTDHTVVKLS